MALRKRRKPRPQTLLKWAMMAASIFWFMAYRLSTLESELAEFIYVSF